MSEFYKDLDRKVAVVNLDPANEQMAYNASIDIVSTINIDEITEICEIFTDIEMTRRMYFW